MAGQKELITELVAKLRSEATIVSLTGHKSNDIRIARDKPEIPAKRPFLGVKAGPSAPVYSADISKLQRTRIELRAYATEITCMEILDALEVLLNEPNDDVTEYYDFSANDISVRSTLFKRRHRSMHNNELDIYTGVVEVDVIWLGESCSS